VSPRSIRHRRRADTDRRPVATKGVPYRSGIRGGDAGGHSRRTSPARDHGGQETDEAEHGHGGADDLVEHGTGHRLGLRR
jgi:hypothetical protein